jgi:soluble lytic murein transglycosylase-like protein
MGVSRGVAAGSLPDGKRVPVTRFSQTVLCTDCERLVEMKLSYQIAIAMALLASASLPASAAESATLRNGFAIRLERHEVRGSVTRFYLSGTTDNYLDVPSAEILSFEEEEEEEEVVSLLAPAPAPPPASTLDDFVSAASSRNNIDPDLILSVIRAESGFNPSAVSPKGAQGLMQLMPGTAALLGVQNALDPATNVEGGTRYLGQLLTRYHNDLSLALAAYNAGPDRVEQYRGVPPYRETRVYVAKIIRDFNRKKIAQRGSQTNLLNNRSAGQNSKATTPSLPGHAKIAGFVRNTSGTGSGS